MLDISSMIYRIPALLFAITVHEYAHAVAADSMGDPTPRHMGRLSFNPMVHLDLIGALMLVFAGFGWAKPVPVNPAKFRSYKKYLSSSYITIFCPLLSSKVNTLQLSLLHTF